jgi:uncharacterized protein (TIGR02217 family)
MFTNTELDICPAYGWQGGPTFNTRVITTQNWEERRNADAILCRHTYSLPLSNILNQAYLTQLKQTYLSCRGMLHSFKVKDYSDFEASNEVFFVGDGTTNTAQLRKTSTFGTLSYVRLINKPNSDIQVFVNGSAVVFTVDQLTGIVTFAVAPALGAVCTWSGEFRVAVRFNSDALAATIDNRNNVDEEYIMNGSVDLIEVFNE